jgi:hypothetical protein
MTDDGLLGGGAAAMEAARAKLQTWLHQALAAPGVKDSKVGTATVSPLLTSMGCSCAFWEL